MRLARALWLVVLSSAWPTPLALQGYAVVGGKEESVLRNAPTKFIQVDDKAFLSSATWRQRRGGKGGIGGTSIGVGGASSESRSESEEDLNAVATTTVASPTAAPPNPPANPFGPSCPNEEVCNGKGDAMEDDASCWDCFASYRTVYCEKNALADTPNWIEKCALEQNIRDAYCLKFAEMDPPVMKEPCFFKDSDYKGVFCQKSYRTGFLKRCAEDDELGEGYCKEFAKELQGYLTCKDHQSYMDVYCDKKSNDTNFDAVCAKNTLIGSAFCMGFAEEEDIQTDCVEHADYLMDFCDKKASDSVEVPTCATDNRTRVTYCNELAMKSEEIDACWPVENFAETYCHEVNYKDSKCLEVQGTEAQDDDDELLDNSSVATTSASEGEAAPSSSNSSGGASGEEAETLAREGDVASMNARLPRGWRSGWDRSEARHFYYPDEAGAAAKSTWQMPKAPWTKSKTRKAASTGTEKKGPVRAPLFPADHMPFSADEQDEHHQHQRALHVQRDDATRAPRGAARQHEVREGQEQRRGRKLRPWQKNKKRFGIMAGANIWHTKQKKHKLAKRLKKSEIQQDRRAFLKGESDGHDASRWRASPQTDMRPPVMFYQGSGKHTFQSSEQAL